MLLQIHMINQDTTKGWDLLFWGLHFPVLAYIAVFIKID